MLKQNKIDRDRAVKSYLYLYTFMVLIVSFTAFYSPFIAVNYTKFILANSSVLFFASYYMIGWKTTKQWWNDKMKEARYRVELKRAVEEEIRKKTNL
jgi:hypothetical protein